MQPFMTVKESARKRAARDLSRNPAPGRTPTQYRRVSRTLDKIAARIRLHLEQSEFADKQWLPSEGLITPKDDEWQHDLHAQYLEHYEVEEDGYLTGWHDDGIKATNRIMAVTWYDNDEGAGFLIKKPIYCPLPCVAWGRLPITLAQWHLIAPMLIESGMLWQWVHAVRNYTEDDSYKIGKIVGWHLETANAVTSIQKLSAAGHGYTLDFRSEEEQQKDADGWTGRNIYLDIIAGFSLVDSEA